MFRQILPVSVCVWKGGSGPAPRQVGMCVCSAVWDSAQDEEDSCIHSQALCVHVCVKRGGTALGGLDGAGAEVKGMWWVREEPRQSQACYL